MHVTHPTLHHQHRRLKQNKMWPLNIFFFCIILIALNTGEFLALFFSLIIYGILLNMWENQIEDTVNDK